MHQFFVEDAQVGREFVTITGADARHIRRALRMKPGEKIRVSSAGGRDFFCVLSEVEDHFAQACILDEDAPSTELSGKIYLFQGIPKGSRMDAVIEKSVELGVYEIIPVAMQYCVARIDPGKEAAKIARWQKQAEAAAKQSKRSRIPAVHSVMTFQEAVAYASSCDARLFPYENERGMDTARKAFASIRPGDSVSVLIGPEGGFSPEEAALAGQSMQAISLGRRILRTDTAGIAVLSMLMLKMETG